MAEQWQINEGEFDRLLREADLEALDQYESGKAEAPVLYKGYGITKAVSEAGPIEFVASEESEDRMGDVIEAAGWELKDFKRNPVFLWSHNSHEPPIGKVNRIGVQGKQLLAAVSFDSADARSAEIEGKFRRGFMKAVSVGFRPIDFKREDSEKGISFRFIKQELLELSAVSVPAHPKALARAMAMADSAKLWVPGWNAPEKKESPITDGSIVTNAHGQAITVGSTSSVTVPLVTSTAADWNDATFYYKVDEPKPLTYEDVKQAAKEAVMEALAAKDITPAIQAQLAADASVEPEEESTLDLIRNAADAFKLSFLAPEEQEA